MEGIRQIKKKRKERCLQVEFLSAQVQGFRKIYLSNTCGAIIKLSLKDSANRDHVHQKWYLSKILEATKQRKCIQVTLLQYAARNMCES